MESGYPQSDQRQIMGIIANDSTLFLISVLGLLDTVRTI